MRYIFFAGLIAGIFLMAFSTIRPFTVSGFVRDEYGNPVAGINVTEKRSKKTTVTGLDGGFTLVTEEQEPLLIFEGVGFVRSEVKVKGVQTPLIVKLKMSANQLNEVVVKGYSGSATERDEEYAAPAVKGLGNINRKMLLSQKAYGVDKTSRVYDNHGLPDTVDSTIFNTEEYDALRENRFLVASDNPLSTFSIDVDAGSYSNVRRYLQMGQLPPAGAVRIEELINYFHYDYPQPTGTDPFSFNTETGNCTWNNSHKLVMIGLQGKKMQTEKLPASNLVFLIDVSGSMMEPEKLPLVQRSLKMLVDQLREEDKVSLVVYAGNAGLVMPSTSGTEKIKIKDAIDRLEAGGSTAGGAGIQLAYKVARQHFVTGGNNRVILCTDGDFNVGPSSDSDLETIIEKERKSGVYLTVLGFGMGNYKDSKMEKLADKGNGNHAYIDNENEARKVLVSEFGGTLFTIAKDVKLQIEFNPATVQAYRLIGYENRMLNKEDFNNDNKDAGELGSGHTVTALYEIIPAGVKNDFMEKTDPLKYQSALKQVAGKGGDELMTIKFRYKNPDGEKSILIEHTVMDFQPLINENSVNFRFVSAVAQFGMLLRNSEFKQGSSYRTVYQLAKNALGKDEEGYRAEFLRLVNGALKISKKEFAPDEEEVSLGY